MEEEFGTRWRVKVRVTFDGHPCQWSLVPMGGECHLLGLVQKVLESIQKEPGDVVSVVLEQDTEPRTVDIPPGLKQWLEINPRIKLTGLALSCYLTFFKNINFHP